MPLFLKEILKIILIVSIFVIGFSLYVCLIYIKPRKFISEATPQYLNLTPFEDIQIQTDDGIKLAAWYISSKKPTDKAVIVCHGYPADKGNVLSICPMLHEKYNIFLFDFRGMGKSTGTTTLGMKETNDFNAAVRYLKEKGMRKIGTLGFSIGGSVIIMANNPDVCAVIADAPFAELDMMLESVYSNFLVLKYPFIFTTKLLAKFLFGVDISLVSPLSAIKNFRTPLLLIHSRQDTQVSVRHSELLHVAYPGSELWILPMSDHGEVQFAYPDEYEKRVLGFFEKNMGDNE